MKNIKERKTESKKKQPNDRLSFLVFTLLIILTALICYQGTYHYPFHLDDYVNFVFPNRIHDLSYFTHLHNWLDPVSRPLSLLTLSLNFNLNGNDTTWYHVVNVAIHILNGLLIFLLTLQISRFFMKNESIRNRQWLAFLTSLLFISHPIQIQGVTYIVQRMTSLAALFYLLSVYLYGEGRIRHCEEVRPKSAYKFYAIALLSLVLAFVSKPNTASLPFMFLLYEVCLVRNKDNKPFLKYILIYSGILLAGLILIIIAGKLPRETTTITRMDYLLTQFKVIPQYIKMLIIPTGFNIDHDVAVAHKFTFMLFLGSLTILVPVLLAVKAFRKEPVITFSIFWFFIALAIESSIIPIRDVMFEHRVYISMWGFSLLLAYLGWKYLAARNPSAFKIVFLVLVLLWSGLTISRNKVWSSEEALWKDAVTKAPNKNRIHRMLGDIYLKQNRFEEALTEYAIGIKLDPNDPETYVNQGAVYEKMKRYQDAWNSYSVAYRINPNNPVLLHNMGQTAISLKQEDTARQLLNRVIKEFPAYREAYVLLGSMAESKGNFEEARHYYMQAVNDMKIGFKANLCMGISYISQDDPKPAIPYLNRSIQLDPQNVSAFFHLGTAYMMLDRIDLAKKYWQKALEIDPSYTAALNNLGVVEYDANNYTAAVEYWEKSFGYDLRQGSMFPLIIDGYHKLGNLEREGYFRQKAQELGYSTKL